VMARRKIEWAPCPHSAKESIAGIGPIILRTIYRPCRGGGKAHWRGLLDCYGWGDNGRWRHSKVEAQRDAERMAIRLLHDYARGARELLADLGHPVEED
jgi:hypothetical protein